MTNKQLREKFPVGTSIIFIARQGMCSAALQDDGKKGKVVGLTSYGKVKILLFESAKNWGKEGEWVTNYCDIRPIKVKGQQLLFAFME